jgi:choline dehydrogenase-like flavoprotein
MPTESYQDCVIGSGAGGAVIAQRLARAGRSVVLLEEGPEVSGPRFNQREGDMYRLLYRDAAGQLTADGAISVLQGRCLGGSTTINMGDCVPTPEPVLEHWRKDFGWGDWGGTSNADIAAAARRVMEDMGASLIADGQHNRNNSLLREGAEKLGLRGSALNHNRTGCRGAGYCTIGCTYDAKRGPLLSHVPGFRAAGGRLRCDARVDRIEPRLGGGWSIAGLGDELLAERVFVCAGPVHSCGILRRSGLGGPHVGKNLTLQPQAPLVGLFPDEVLFYRGIPQSWGLDGEITATPEGGLSGFTVEGVSAGPAMSASMFPAEIDNLSEMLGRYRKFGAALNLVPDRPSGEVVWSKRKPRPKIRYRPTEEWVGRMRKALKTCARIWLAAGADEVRVPVLDCPPIKTESQIARIDDLPMRSCDLPMISAHPQGTCRMAGDGHEAVVDLDFRVVGTRDVYVCDASIFPTSASTHTMVPVMAMAHLLAESLGG